MISVYLDKADYRILSLLREDSRVALKELAAAADVSIPTARSRIIRLKDLGVIKRFTASLELQSITNQVTAYITLRTRLPNIKTVVEHLKDIDEVSEAYITTGQHDVILKIHTPNMQALNRLVTQKLSSLEGVETAYSSFVIETVKDIIGPVLRPNFGFKIDCENCGGIVGEGYVKKLTDGREHFFCSEPCLSASTGFVK